MRDDLLHYYERELTFLRRMGAEFGATYPKVASRLLLEPSKCDDPHVERLLEAFAFLAARVHLKIDDDFSEISEALLHILYPNYIRPIPSMAMVQFVLDPKQGKLTSGLDIKKDSLLYSRPVGGVPCKYRTCYDTTLWPLTLSEAAWQTPDQLNPSIKTDAVSALRVKFDCLPDVSFEALGLDTLRLYLNGEGNLVSTLYELLCNNCTRILVRDPANKKRAPVEFGPSALRPVGFAQDEGMLPYPRRAFLGYRLLQEYFAFPAKFSFLDLSVFEAVRSGGFGTSVEVIFLISQFDKPDRREMLETGVKAKTLRLGCTPIVNLFQQTSEPVLMNQRTYEYPVVADARRRDTTSIFSVDSVAGVTVGAGAQPQYEPFYSFRHGTNGDGDRSSYWYAKRRAAGWRTDAGSDVYLSFVDLSARPVRPSEDSVTAKLTCFNGDLPSRLPFGDEQGDWELPGGEPVQKILTLVKPTKVVQPPLGKPQLWRLISQLSLNYLSLVEGGTEPFQELLRLHNFEDFEDSASVEKQIQGIVDIQAAPRYSRIDSEHGLSFARGHQVTVEFDEDHFTGGGVYLFASVLDHFFGLYTSINSFSILAAKTRQRRTLLREWAPRAGWKALL